VNARLAWGLPMVTLVFAAAAAAALLAGGQTAEAAMGARHPAAPATVTADESRPQPAATTGTHDSAAEQMGHIVHELHADGRNAQCTVCDSQYRTA